MERLISEGAYTEEPEQKKRFETSFSRANQKSKDICRQAGSSTEL